MNKFAKGSLAAGAGLVLLLGGAGTLAYWTSEADLAGGSINTGQLNLDVDTVDSSGAPKVWVPGDEGTYTTNLLLTAEGDNIQGEIRLDAESVKFTKGVGEGESEPTESITLSVVPGAGELPEGVTYHTADENNELGYFSFDSGIGDGAQAIPVEITVSFPYGDEADNDSQSATVDLKNVNFVAEQTDPKNP